MLTFIYQMTELTGKKDKEIVYFMRRNKLSKCTVENTFEATFDYHCALSFVSVVLLITVLCQ